MEEITLDLRDLWKIARKRKFIIIGITLLCMILGLAMSFTPKKVEIVETKNELYKSTASVIIGTFPDAKSENIKDITILNQQIVKTYGAIANSRTVAEKTIKELNLDTKTDKFMTNIKVKTNAETQVVTIMYGSREEKDVQKVNDTYLKIFVEEAKKTYPEVKVKVLDMPSKPEKILEEDYDKIGISSNPNQTQQTQQTQKTAVTAENKYKSKKSILAMSTFLGLMVGFGAAFVVEYMGNSIRKKEEAEAILNMPIIGEIKKDRKADNESYKILRTILQYKNSDLLEFRGGQPNNNAFMITSPSKGDGKTTTATNLAVSFAEAGFKTLIIDANGRNPMVHTILGLDNDKGLSNMLIGEMVNIRKSNKENLCVLSWGNSNVNPADTFVKGNISKVMSKLREEFDYVIIDTPSIVEYADAGILSKSVNEVIVVIAEDKTNRNEVLITKQRIDAIGMKVCGVLWVKTYS